MRLNAKVAAAKQRYLTAWRWRRAVEAELSALALTFTQWLVLEALHSLVVESGDATNQNAVVERAELDRATISQVMATLARRGLVDRGPDMYGRGYRIFLTDSGLEALADGAACLETATLGQQDRRFPPGGRVTRPDRG